MSDYLLKLILRYVKAFVFMLVISVVVNGAITFSNLTLSLFLAGVDLLIYMLVLKK